MKTRAATANVPSVPRRLRGQASVEYTMVLILVVLVLIAEQNGESGPVTEVVAAIKDVFSAFSYAISLTTNLTPL
jgi:Flp pilus assembly pilin Flp